MGGQYFSVRFHCNGGLTILDPPRIAGCTQVFFPLLLFRVSRHRRVLSIESELSILNEVLAKREQPKSKLVPPAPPLHPPPHLVCSAVCDCVV